MQQQILKYLYSSKNIVGSALALLGLVLFFLGVVGTLWPVIVIGLYLIGVLVTPGTATIDLRSGFDPDDVRKALDHEVHVVSGRGPADVFAKVQSIQQIILGILPRAGDSRSCSSASQPRTTISRPRWRATSPCRAPTRPSIRCRTARHRSRSC